MNNRVFGTKGEQEAARYLAVKGYTILCRNFRAGRLGEIDIIGRDGETLCFIEVKTRSNCRYGTPAQAVSSLKQGNIRRLAQIYMRRHGYSDLPVRFDVVELFMDRNGYKQELRLIKNAF